MAQGRVGRGHVPEQGEKLTGRRSTHTTAAAGLTAGRSRSWLEVGRAEMENDRGNRNHECNTGRQYDQVIVHGSRLDLALE
jgi:hypothetical protein